MTLTGLCLTLWLRHPQLPFDRKVLGCALAPAVVVAARVHHVPPPLLAGVVYVESRWNRRAVSGGPCCGLAQVNPRWTPGVTCSDLLWPLRGLWEGAAALERWKHRRPTWRAALACYHTGNKCRGSRYESQVLRESQLLERMSLTTR